MTDFIKIDFPENSEEFQQGIVLLDEAVCKFMHSSHPMAEAYERIIGAIVREYGDRSNENHG